MIIKTSFNGCFPTASKSFSLSTARIIGHRYSIGRCWEELARKGAYAVSKRVCGMFCAVGSAIVTGALIVATPCAAQQLTNDKLSLTVNTKDGSYQLAVRGGQPIFTSRVAAQVDHQWLRSNQYPRHRASESAFTDELGSGRAV